MARRPINLGENDRDEQFVEFTFDANGLITLRDLSESFAALDAMYARTTNGDERLAIVELRSGSIIAAVAPFMPFMGHALIAIEATITLTEFTTGLKSAIDGFSGKSLDDKNLTDSRFAKEIAELVKPLTGKDGAKFGFAKIRAKAKTKDRTVEVEAEYSAAEIDRAFINAERHSQILEPQTLIANDESEPALAREVELVLHQTNIGPAKEKGQTGDKGVIASVSDKPLPLYFAPSISNLKDKLVRAKSNPLGQHMNVDAWVIRDKGIPKSYTILEVHNPRSLAAYNNPLLPLR